MHLDLVHIKATLENSYTFYVVFPWSVEYHWFALLKDFKATDFCTKGNWSVILEVIIVTTIMFWDESRMWFSSVILHQFLLHLWEFSINYSGLCAAWTMGNFFHFPAFINSSHISTDQLLIIALSSRFRVTRRENQLCRRQQVASHFSKACSNRYISLATADPLDCHLKRNNCFRKDSWAFV